VRPERGQQSGRGVGAGRRPFCVFALSARVMRILATRPQGPDRQETRTQTPSTASYSSLKTRERKSKPHRSGRRASQRWFRARPHHRLPDPSIPQRRKSQPAHRAPRMHKSGTGALGAGTGKRAFKSPFKSPAMALETGRVAAAPYLGLACPDICPDDIRADARLDRVRAYCSRGLS
jgi:hypothetical protein